MLFLDCRRVFTAQAAVLLFSLLEESHLAMKVFVRILAAGIVACAAAQPIHGWAQG
jgi:hypothetical protein